MIKYLDSNNFGTSKLDWLFSRFHFSFAEYYNPKNIRFGVLRVMNDDLVKPETGFDTHPHENMEIISYVVDGKLTHKDSMGNEHTLTKGQVQYMSAGTGVWHSEYNNDKEEILRFFQVWVLPDRAGHQPNYGDYRFNWEDRQGRWLPIASGDGDKDFPIQVHQDIHFYATEIKAGESLDFKVGKDRQAYLAIIEGNAKVKDVFMKMRDALEITEEDITLQALDDTHAVIMEMKKDATGNE